jgi:hypothetical protein
MIVSSYCYIEVLILLYMCPHTAICVLKLLYMCTYTAICVLILLYMCGQYKKTRDEELHIAVAAAYMCVISCLYAAPGLSSSCLCVCVSSAAYMQLTHI